MDTRWDGWALFHDPLNIFNANINYPAPYTLALSDHLFGLLPNWILGYLISGDMVGAHNWAHLFTYIISGVGAFFFFRCWKMHYVAALLGAVFFTFYLHPFVVTQIQMSAFGYTFIVFLFLERYLRDGGRLNLVFMSLSFIIAFLTGFYYAYMLTMAFWIYVLLSLATDRERMTWRKFLYISGTFVVSIIVLSPTIWPYVLMRREAHALVEASKDMLLTYSQQIETDPGAIRAFFYHAFKYRLIAIAGSVYLLLKGSRDLRRGVTIFLCIAILFHMLRLGPYLQINGEITSIPLPHKLFSLIPGFTQMRYVSRFHLMAYVGEVFLLACAIQCLIPKQKILEKPLLNIVRMGIVFLYAVKIFGDFQVGADGLLPPVVHKDNLPPIYNRLISDTESAPIAEFPLIPSLKMGKYTYQYISLFHWRKLYNGFSGYTPPGHSKAPVSKQTAAQWTQYLRVLGIKYIISHPPDFMARVIERGYEGKSLDLEPLPPPGLF